MRQRNVSIVIVFCVLAAALLLIWVSANWEFTDLESLDVVVLLRTGSDNPCLYPQPTDRYIDETEAVAAAECFVIQNGYTELPPSSDKSKITPENVFPLTDESGMKMRHDSLERRAATVLRDTEFFGGSLIVMFRGKGPVFAANYSDDLANTWGRAVVMDFNGKHARIMHSPHPMKLPGGRVLYDYEK